MYIFTLKIIRRFASLLQWEKVARFTATDEVLSYMYYQNKPHLTMFAPKLSPKLQHPVSATPFRGGYATLNPPLGHAKVREKKSIFMFLSHCRESKIIFNKSNMHRPALQASCNSTMKQKCMLARAFLRSRQYSR